MDLEIIAVTFLILLSPVWASSHHSYMDSILSARSGKSSFVCVCVCVHVPLHLMRTALFSPLSRQVPGRADEV